MANELKSYVKDYMTKNVITVKPETPNTEVIKKRIALRQEKEAARLKAKKQRLSKNFEKKDTN